MLELIGTENRIRIYGRKEELTHSKTRLFFDRLLHGEPVVQRVQFIRNTPQVWRNANERIIR